MREGDSESCTAHSKTLSGVRADDSPSGQRGPICLWLESTYAIHGALRSESSRLWRLVEQVEGHQRLLLSSQLPDSGGGSWSAEHSGHIIRIRTFHDSLHRLVCSQRKSSGPVQRTVARTAWRAD